MTWQFRLIRVQLAISVSVPAIVLALAQSQKLKKISRDYGLAAMAMTRTMAGTGAAKWDEGSLITISIISLVSSSRD